MARNKMFKLFEILWQEADIFFFKLHTKRGCNTHNYLFAEHRRKNRYTKVNFHTADLIVNTTVLRNTLFCDIHITDKFYTARNRRNKLRSCFHINLAVTIYTEAYSHTLFHRLDMNITSLLINGFFHHIINKTNNRLVIS